MVIIRVMFCYQVEATVLFLEFFEWLGVEFYSPSAVSLFLYHWVSYSLCCAFFFTILKNQRFVWVKILLFFLTIIDYVSELYCFIFLQYFFRPQLLVMTGYPRNRPAIVDLACLITKRQSLMLCAHVFQVYKFLNAFLLTHWAFRWRSMARKKPGGRYCLCVL